MDRRRERSLGRPAWAVLFLFLALALLCPPLVGIPARAGGAFLLLYLLAAWAGLVLGLSVLARHRAPPRPGGRP